MANNVLFYFFNIYSKFFMFYLYLLHDTLLVVVAQRPAEFVIVHCWAVLLDPPSTRHLSGTRHTVSNLRQLKGNSI